MKSSFVLIYIIFVYSISAELLNQKLELEPKAESSEPRVKSVRPPEKDEPLQNKQTIPSKPKLTPKSFVFQKPFTEKLLTKTGFVDNPENPHRGILFEAVTTGTVISSLEGKVVAVDYMDGYHNYIILEHPNGYYTIYGNLQDVLVGEGQHVKKGETLGILLKEKGLYFQISQGKKAIDPNLIIKS